MNIEEIANIFVESVFLKIPYEEMKKRKYGEKINESTTKDNKKKEVNNLSINSNNKKTKQKNTNKKNNKKITEIENDLYTPIKTITNNNKIDIKYTSNNSKKIPKTTKSAEKRKKKIKINKIELTDNKQEINRKINYNLFSEEKLRKNKKNKKKLNSIDSSLKLTKDLIKKQQEEIDFNRKFDYLKNRIEALKIKEEKIRMEKNYIQKKEIKLGKNMANKKKQKIMLEELKKKENDKMKNRKESAKKIYEEENKVLKNFGSELCLKNREYFLQLKKEKEKLKIEKAKHDEEIMRQRKNKMILNKKKNINNKELNENLEIKNNQKMNYIFSTKSIEYLKQNIKNLERLEKEYIKKIQDEKKGINDIPKRRNISAKKSRKRYKLNDDIKKNVLGDEQKKEEKEYSVEAKENNNIDIDIDNIKLEEKINYEYKDDSLKSDNSQEINNIPENNKENNLEKEEKEKQKEETEEQKEEKDDQKEEKEITPQLLTLDKIITQNN